MLRRIKTCLFWGLDRQFIPPNVTKYSELYLIQLLGSRFATIILRRCFMPLEANLGRERVNSSLQILQAHLIEITTLDYRNSTAANIGEMIVRGLCLRAPYWLPGTSRRHVVCEK
jgi:hypothetical protein